MNVRQHIGGAARLPWSANARCQRHSYKQLNPTLSSEFRIYWSFNKNP